MAIRSPSASSALARLIFTRLPLRSLIEMDRFRFPRYFGDGTGRVLSEEERAKETVYIQKMERERLEKLRKKMEREKTESDKSDKKTEELHKA